MNLLPTTLKSESTYQSKQMSTSYNDGSWKLNNMILEILEVVNKLLMELVVL